MLIMTGKNTLLRQTESRQTYLEFLLSPTVQINAGHSEFIICFSDMTKAYFFESSSICNSKY